MEKLKAEFITEITEEFLGENEDEDKKVFVLAILRQLLEEEEVPIKSLKAIDKMTEDELELFYDNAEAGVELLIKFAQQQGSDMLAVLAELFRKNERYGDLSEVLPIYLKMVFPQNTNSQKGMLKIIMEELIKANA